MNGLNGENNECISFYRSKSGVSRNDKRTCTIPFILSSLATTVKTTRREWCFVRTRIERKKRYTIEGSTSARGNSVLCSSPDNFCISVKCLRLN